MYSMDIENEKDFVVTAVSEIVASEIVDGETYEASSLQSVSFEIVQEKNFIPYEDLTEDKVIGWIKDSMGVKGVEVLEESLASQIDYKINPPVTPTAKPLPW